MSDPKPPVNDLDLVEILDLLDGASEDRRQDILSELEPHVQEELNQALAAQLLLAQISTIHPPETLPSQTARRTRRRLRAQSEVIQNKSDHIVTVAVVALIFSIIFLVMHQVKELKKREEIKVIKLQQDQED